VVLSWLFLMAASVGWTNGGPFVVKYPEGDPAAKGVLARLGPDLKPMRETRLRVVKEDLSVTFGRTALHRSEGSLPLAAVSAAYTIENPTAETVEVDFGFPILRGVYLDPFSMVPQPDVQVTLGDHDLSATIISNSAIYGIIRASARRAIDRGLAADRRLSELAGAVREGREGTRDALLAYLTKTLDWSPRDAALLAEYAGLDLGEARGLARDRSWVWMRDETLGQLVEANLGPLAAIGEQKATQLFAQLAGCFEPETAATYEALFAAWGGDVRERSVDLLTGEVRPREIDVDPGNADELGVPPAYDPTVYARVDYFDENAPISDAEKAACRTILRNLPVVFTFAPMNLLYYRATFPPGETHLLTVRYGQYACRDTRDPASYQVAYVVHPASLWDDFGPINLEVALPVGVGFRASVACQKGDPEDRPGVVAPHYAVAEEQVACDIYRGRVGDRTGELFLAVDEASWRAHLPPPDEETAQAMAPPQRQP
jgi:hypothetical protein